MKKYIKPTMQVVRMSTTTILAASETLSVSGTHNGGFASRRKDWDEEDEEDEE